MYYAKLFSFKLYPDDTQRLDELVNHLKNNAGPWHWSTGSATRTSAIRTALRWAIERMNAATSDNVAPPAERIDVSAPAKKKKAVVKKPQKRGKKLAS